MTTLPIQFPNTAPRPTWRGLLLLTLMIAGLLVFYYALKHPAESRQEITQAQMFDLIKQGRVVSIVNEPDAATGIRHLTGIYRLDHVPATNPYSRGAFQVDVDLQLDPNLLNELHQAGYNGTIETVNNTSIVLPLLVNLLPLAAVGLLVSLVIIFVSRRSARKSG